MRRTLRVSLAILIFLAFGGAFFADPPDAPIAVQRGDLPADFLFTTEGELYANRDADLFLSYSTPMSVCDDASDCAEALEKACQAAGSTVSKVYIDLAKRQCEATCADGSAASAVCSKKPRPGSIIFYEDTTNGD